MSHLTFSAYPGFGDKAKKDHSYSQAVRFGDLIHCSGQDSCSRTAQSLAAALIDDLRIVSCSIARRLGCGDRNYCKFGDSVAAQIEQAFKNVELALQNAGGKGWEQVYRVVSYHVGFDAEEVLGPIIGTLKQYMPNHQPIWTAIGVEKLAFPEMKVEIEVSAHVRPTNTSN